MPGRKKERFVFRLAGAAGLAASVWVWASGFSGLPLGKWLLLLLAAAVNAVVAILPAFFLSVAAVGVWRRLVVSPMSDVVENGTPVPDYKRNGTPVPDYKRFSRMVTGLGVVLAATTLSALVGAVAGFLVCWLILSCLPIPFPGDTILAVAFVAGGLSGLLSGGIATAGLLRVQPRER